MQWFLVGVEVLLGAAVWCVPQLSRRTVPLGVDVPPTMSPIRSRAPRSSATGWLSGQSRWCRRWSLLVRRTWSTGLLSLTFAVLSVAVYLDASPGVRRAGFVGALVLDAIVVAGTVVVALRVRSRSDDLAWQHRTDHRTGGAASDTESPDDDRCWKGGLIYVNRADLALGLVVALVVGTLVLPLFTH